MWVRKAKVGIHDTCISYKTQYMETLIYICMCIYLCITATRNTSTSKIVVCRRHIQMGRIGLTVVFEEEHICTSDRVCIDQPCMYG